MKKWIFQLLILGFVLLGLSFTDWSLETNGVALQSKTLNAETQILVNAAKDQVGKTMIYDPSYQKLDYPNGDIPMNKGVCTDVIIRSFRAIKLDLQKLVHIDMKNNFSTYPKIWGLKRTDTNIDHRRVPNLRVYFKRVGWRLPVQLDPANFLPGDIVTWVFSNGREHIGIVSNQYKKNRPLIIHNVGSGTVFEDVLFDWKITDHFRRVK